MVIIGVDPGLAIVGYGVIDYDERRRSFTTLDCGAITTPANTPVCDRLATIYDEMDELISLYRPHAMALEEIFFNTNQKTAIAVAQARGVLMLCAKKRGVQLFEYTPLQVKQAIVGYGRAEKSQVIAMVSTILNLKKAPRLDDTADALAIAVCHARTRSSRLQAYMGR
ncbi:MAG: crossover junction endodeoxyribonuclease RuvC [Clostridiales bacterium]|nr:crossover junction endodeoxyribonuclease RuvC [Clostridiales bacterium]